MKVRGFIFEGCDRAGKSTLAQAVAKRIGATVSHNNKSSVDWSSDVAISEAMLVSPVIDRLYESEYVYASAIGRRTFVDGRRLSSLRRMQRNNGYLTVMVCSPEEVIRERYENSLDEYVDADTAIGIQRAFCEMYENGDHRVMVVNGDAHSDEFEKIIDRIVQDYAVD